MGIVNAGMLEVYEEIEPELKVLVEDVLLNRRPDATERLVDFGETLKDEGARRQRKEGRRVAQRHGRRAPFARAGQGHRHLHRDRHRGSARQAGPPAAGDRRPADGRHERGGRSVRRGQNVPAAGGQIRARDEEGRGASDAFHGGRKSCHGGRRPGGQGAGQNRARHGQGRRARHRQEHRRRGAGLQQLRSHRSWA